MSEKLEVGSIVEGKVIRVKPFGAIVSIGEQAQGLVHISQVANSFVQDINDHVKVGANGTLKVMYVDPRTWYWFLYVGTERLGARVGRPLGVG